MKKQILTAFVLIVLSMSSTAFAWDFDADMAAADQRREAKQALKKRGIKNPTADQVRNEIATGNYTLKATEESKEKKDEKAKSEPVVNEKKDSVGCENGVAFYKGSLFGAAVSKTATEITSAGVIISRTDSISGGITHDFYYHPELDILVEQQMQKGKVWRSIVWVMDSDQQIHVNDLGDANGMDITYKSAVVNNQGVYNQVCKEKVSEIGSRHNFIRAGFLRRLTFVDKTEKLNANDALIYSGEGERKYQFSPEYKAVINKYSENYSGSYPVIKDPEAFIIKLLVPATKEAFYADITAYFGTFLEKDIKDISTSNSNPAINNGNPLVKSPNGAVDWNQTIYGKKRR